ncbi:MAG: hypothetical protein Kow0090_15080 [Myxococcota bacterium]
MRHSGKQGGVFIAGFVSAGENPPRPLDLVAELPLYIRKKRDTVVIPIESALAYNDLPDEFVRLFMGDRIGDA